MVKNLKIKTCFCSLLLSIFLVCTKLLYATDDIGMYRIQLATCTTAQQAESIQQSVSSHANSLQYIASLGYSTTVSISLTDGNYLVYVGNYPTYGEARYISRELVRQGYQITLEQIKEPIPDPATITGTADAIYSQASTFESKKDYSRAIAYYTAFTNQYLTDARSDRALIQIGICKTKLIDFTGALAVFQTIANSASPLAAEAQWRIGYAYLSLYQLDNAQAAFALVTSRFPDSTIVTDAKERLKAFISSGPDDALYKQAMFAIAAKKYSIAIDYLNQYTTNYPTTARIDEAYLRLANCKINLGDKPGAFDGYKQVIQYPQSRFAKDVCGELATLAVSLGSTYIDSAIDALRQSPCLSPDNQELGGFFQTYIAWLANEKVPKTLGGKLTSSNSTLADQSACWVAIAECRKVKEVYPNANRYDLARAALMEVESFCRFDNETTVIELAKQLIATYPDQRKSACYAQHLIARAYENLQDHNNALQSYQTLLDTYTEADNITTGDDLIAMALFRKAKCLLALDRTDEAKKTLQEIVQNHEQSSVVIGAKQELKLLNEGVIVLTEEEMQQIIGAGEHCYCINWCGIEGCVCPRGCDCSSQPCRCGWVNCDHTCTNCSCPKACNYCGCSNCAKPCPCGFTGCPPCPVYYPNCPSFLPICAKAYWKCVVPCCPCAGVCYAGTHTCNPCNNLTKPCSHIPPSCICIHCLCSPTCSRYSRDPCFIA